jgi:hypothetical protein
MMWLKAAERHADVFMEGHGSWRLLVEVFERGSINKAKSMVMMSVFACGSSRCGTLAI